MTNREGHPSGLPPDPNEPKFSREELASIKFEDADIDAELDAEEATRDAELRRLGFTDEQVARVRGRPVVEAAPKPTLADVEAQLEELRELRKTNRQRYWLPETQAKEAGLYATLEQMKAAGASAKEEGEAKAADAIGELPDALREEWSRSGPDGIEDALRAVRFRATMAFDQLEDAGEALRDTFDQLPSDAQDAVAAVLADDAGKWPVASAQEVQEFGELEHGGALLKEWGDAAPKLLGRARREADAIMSRLTEQSKLKMHYWIAGRSPAELRGMVRALAARARRRL